MRKPRRCAKRRERFRRPDVFPRRSAAVLEERAATRRPALTAVSRLNSYAFQSAEIQALGLARSSPARNSPEEVLVPPCARIG